jgi:hypothetical protein
MSVEKRVILSPAFVEPASKIGFGLRFKILSGLPLALGLTTQ